MTTMTCVKQGLLLLIVLPILWLPLEGWASHDQVACTSKPKNVKAVSIASLHIANVNFTSGGVFDPVPLLTTTVTVGGGNLSCLVAHFSAIPRPTDNHIVFQVRVDGEPMEGHVPDLFGTGTPAVSDPNQTDEFIDVQRMVAYTFFKQVKPGDHTVEVLFAACCSAGSGVGITFVDAAVLTLAFQ